MLVSKIGDDLAVRLSADDAARLGLKEGDRVIVRLEESIPPSITDPAERKAAVERLRRFEGLLPDDFKFDRDEANAR